MDITTVIYIFLWHSDGGCLRTELSQDANFGGRSYRWMQESGRKCRDISVGTQMSPDAIFVDSPRRYGLGTFRCSNLYDLAKPTPSSLVIVSLSFVVHTLGMHRRPLSSPD